MTQLLTGLIDKVDTFEAVRDQIALILANEVANQQVLAQAAGKDPALWLLKVYRERANPWEQALAVTDTPTGPIPPIVNVYYDGGTFPGESGGVVLEQMHEGRFNLDVYGFAVSSDAAQGHNPGDREAAFACQRAVRLVRNILMAAANTYLQLQKIVWQRWPDSLTMMQPQQDQNPVVRVMAARLVLRVRFTETAEQVAGEILEDIRVEVDRLVDGQLQLEAEYPHPQP